MDGDFEALTVADLPETPAFENPGLTNAFVASRQVHSFLPPSFPPTPITPIARPCRPFSSADPTNHASEPQSHHNRTPLASTQRPLQAFNKHQQPRSPRGR